MIKIVNIYLVYDLAAWSINLTKNLKFQNCLFRATNVVKTSDKEENLYSRYWITFDSADSWRFDNYFPRNFLIFGVNNRSSLYSNNQKNNLLKLGEGPTYGINGCLGSPERKISINISQTNTKFGLSLH